MRDQLGYKNENNRNASIIAVQHYCDIHITNKKNKEYRILNPGDQILNQSHCMIHLYEDRNIAVLNRFAYVTISNNKKKLQDDQYMLR
jgi:hypothetical protein